MNSLDLENYERIAAGAIGFIEQKRGLIEVSGKEAAQFLNGLITNDVAKLEPGAQMPAAFPNAQGRSLAVVRVIRIGDAFLFETEAATHEKVYNNLFRFTFAGDFFVADKSDDYRYFSIVNVREAETEAAIEFASNFGKDVFVSTDAAEKFVEILKNQDAVEISPELYEVLRIERGVLIYGADIDETTIVPETAIENLISYTKGCYIGQEIIARIYFRGHVAKQMRGLIFEDETADAQPNGELKSPEGKAAGRITSVTFSPKLNRKIALAYVRYEFLAEDTELKSGEAAALVKNLPLVG